MIYFRTQGLYSIVKNRNNTDLTETIPTDKTRFDKHLTS